MGESGVKLRYCGSYIYQPSCVTSIPLLLSKKYPNGSLPLLKCRRRSSLLRHTCCRCSFCKVCYLWEVFTVSGSSFCTVNGKNHGWIFVEIVHSLFLCVMPMVSLYILADLTDLNWAAYILMVLFLTWGQWMGGVIWGLFKASTWNLSWTTGWQLKLHSSI